MSADQSHQKRAPSTSEAVRMVPNIVPPQAVSDRSIIDSVAGFINDVALTNVPQTNAKDHILWVKFENLADISDTSLGEDWDVDGSLPPPLLLCIGYGSGIQVWAVPANGEAIEVMSWKHGSVSVLRILPTPFLSNNSELANDLLDQFIHKRPLMTLVGDCPIANQAPSTQNQQLYAVNFVSLKDGDLVKTIKFKSPILDIVANRTSIAITFYERIAIFDARTLEDRLTVTTCYPCPNGLCPIALGDRWLAYAERKLIPSKASAGGCFIDGVPSYTATVLNAAKSLGKGLRELGEQVAANLVGGNISNSSSNSSGNFSPSVASADGTQPGVVTILDIKHVIKDISPTSGTPIAINGNDPIIAHFLAHTEAVYAMSFDPSGMLLLTSDKRGHDFNVFRIQPHPCGSVLAAVHHLYVLHRGDTSAKVQDISFSFDSRWVAVSTIRGTTHVFPVTPYGGTCGFRTHSAPHVVNRLSRFHRSAGLPVDGRSSSPILMAEHAQSTAYANPRLPPFPHPTVILPLAQLRQPSSLNSASALMSQTTTQQQSSKGFSTRQRLHSTNEESHSKPLRVAAVFAKARSWLLDPPGMHDTSRLNRRSVDSLFIVAGHGALIQYDLEPRHATNLSKEKICDETPIELEVEAKAQWVLGQRTNSQMEISPPLTADNWLIKDRVIDNNLNLDTSQMDMIRSDERDDRWLSQVEIVTHAGPSRRLWMGPQFVFKLYNTPSGNSLAHIEVESIEVGAARARSTPVNMPSISKISSRPLVPVLIESGSCSSHEQSPRLFDSFHYESTDSDIVVGPDSQLKEDLADAMRDCATTIPTNNNNRETGMTTSDASRQALSLDSLTSEGISSHTVVVSVVNPQGTITNVTTSDTANEIHETFSNDNYILENCDEAMFRPFIAVLNTSSQHFTDESINIEECSKPVEMPLELVVPVIDERVIEEKKQRRQQDKILKQKFEMEQREEAERIKKQIAAEEEEEKRVKRENELKKQIEDEKVASKKREDDERKALVDVVKKEESLTQSRKNKKAQKYSNKKSAVDTVSKKITETKKEEPIVVEKEEEQQVTKEAEEMQVVDEIVKDEVDEIRPVQAELLADIMEKVDLNIEEIIMEVPVVEETLRLSAELPIIEEKPTDLPIINTELVIETPLEDHPVVEVMPEIIVAEKQVQPEDAPFVKKYKKGKKQKFKFDDHRDADKDAIMKISNHELIGDDDIQIIPQGSSSSVEVREKSPEKLEQFIKSDDFFDIDDELPPLEPFDMNMEADIEKCDEEFSQKQEMKKKMSELLKDTNMVFAMCSSLKEIKEGDVSLSSASQIQRSTSSSLTTNTTTSTFASASSNVVGEGHDSDYKSMDLELEEAATQEPPAVEIEFKIPLTINLQVPSPPSPPPSQQDKKDDPDDGSSFEATSSETDESSKNLVTKFKRDDDEELRPLLETSITSLTSPVDATVSTNITTEANATSTLPDINQKSLATTTMGNNNGNNGKRKNKKKRR